MTELKPYPAYKASRVEWLDEIPATWQVMPLMGIASEAKRRNYGLAERNLLSLSYGRVVTKNIDTNDGLLPESFETYQIVDPDDIVFRLTDLQNDKRSLRSALVEQRGIITSAYLAVTPRSVDPRFLSYAMRDTDLRKVFYSMGGGLRQSMKYADMKRLPVVLPNIQEQFNIADFLDRETAEIDAFIADQEEFIGLLAERRAATISHAVTKGLDPTVPMKDSGIEWLGEIPAHWSVLALKRVLRGIEQGVSPQADGGLANEDAVGVLKAGCVNHGVFNELEHKRLPDGFEFDDAIRVRVGDLIVNRASGSPSLVGSAARVRSLHYALILSDKTFRLRTSPSVDPNFLELYLNSTPYRRQVIGAISGAEGLANNLPMGALKEIVLALPPRDEQSRVVDSARNEEAELDAAIADAAQAVALSRERRAALISAAVTGKIDVRGVGVVA